MNNLRAWFAENNFNTIKEGAELLTEQLGISVKEYEEEGLFVLNYSQFASPKTDPVVIECRGLIVDNDLNPVCRPFDRFFNLGEALEITDQFDFTTADFYEKADGSLVKVYYHNREWHVATRGTAFAESANYTGETFQNLIAKAFGCETIDELKERLKPLAPNCTYCFEYTSPLNRIVTPYKVDEMVLLGVRRTISGIPIDGYAGLTFAAEVFSRDLGLNVRPANRYRFNSREEMLEAVQSLPGLQEGFVGVDHKGNRVKIKSDVYVQVHRLRGDTLPTPKRISELVVTNETEEYLAYFPEDREMFQPYMDNFDKMCGEAAMVFDTADAAESQKDFALQVKDYCFSGALFAARKNGTDFLKEYMSVPVNARVKVFMSYMEQTK